MINRFSCTPFIKYPEQKVFWQILHFYMEIVLFLESSEFVSLTHQLACCLGIIFESSPFHSEVYPELQMKYTVTLQT